MDLMQMDSNTFSNKILIFSDRLYRMANSIIRLNEFFLYFCRT